MSIYYKLTGLCALGALISLALVSLAGWEIGYLLGAFFLILFLVFGTKAGLNSKSNLASEEGVAFHASIRSSARFDVASFPFILMALALMYLALFVFRSTAIFVVATIILFIILAVGRIKAWRVYAEGGKMALEQISKNPPRTWKDVFWPVVFVLCGLVLWYFVFRKTGGGEMVFSVENLFV